MTLAGLPTDRFFFLGFLPSKEQARAAAIAEVAAIRATLVIYESGPRLSACLTALAAGLGDREAAVTREITKRFEEAVTGTLTMLAARYADSPPKGEIVVVVAPPGEAPPAAADDVDAALADALTRLPADAPPPAHHRHKSSDVPPGARGASSAQQSSPAPPPPNYAAEVTNDDEACKSRNEREYGAGTDTRGVMAGGQYDRADERPMGVQPTEEGECSLAQRDEAGWIG